MNSIAPPCSGARVRPNDPTYRAFLEDILNDPADFTPRRILADWLDDHGLEPERAKLLRTPRAALFTSGKKNGQRFAEVIDLRHEGTPKRWFTLSYPELGDRWFSDVCGQACWTGRACVGYGVRHGFVSEVCAPQRWWLKHGPALVRRHPVADVVLQDVHLVDAARFSTDGCHDRGWRMRTTAHPAGVDSWLFVNLPDGRRPSHDRRDYQSAEKAVAALSHACVTWARHEAGYNPWTFDSPLAGCTRFPVQPAWANLPAIEVLCELKRAGVWLDVTDDGEISLRGDRLDDRLRGLVAQHRQAIVEYHLSRRAD